MSFIVKEKLQFIDCNEVSKLLYKLIVSWGSFKLNIKVSMLKPFVLVLQFTPQS